MDIDKDSAPSDRRNQSLSKAELKKTPKKNTQDAELPQLP